MPNMAPSPKPDRPRELPEPADHCDLPDVNQMAFRIVAAATAEKTVEAPVERAERRPETTRPSAV